LAVNSIARELLGMIGDYDYETKPVLKTSQGVNRQVRNWKYSFSIWLRNTFLSLG